MKRKVWISFGILSAFLGSAYVIQRPSDNEHICRKIGSDLELTSVAKLWNYFGTKYLEKTNKHFTKFDISNLISDKYLEKEVDLLTLNWNPSSICNKSSKELLEKEKRFYNAYESALNHKLCPYSPLGRFIENINNSKRINNRKQIIDYISENPDILEGDSIDSNNRLLVVVGMHRTGSTLLQNLLSQDPNSRTTFTWEMMRTIPPATSKSEIYSNERINKIRSDLSKSNYICPNFITSFLKFHYFAPDKPEEDCLLLHGILAQWYILYLLQDIDNTLPSLLRDCSDYLCRYLHLYLKLVNSSCPPKSHWVLKNPDHSQYLLTFLDEFPKANIIVTHRNPINVVLSWTTMMLYSNHINIYNDYTKYLDNSPILTQEGWGKIWLKQSSEEINQLVQAREELKLINPEQEQRIYDVCFSELVKDPVKVIRNIYDHFGYEFTEEFENNIINYMKENPSGKYGRVKYSMDDFKFTKDIINKPFKDYISIYSKYF